VILIVDSDTAVIKTLSVQLFQLGFDSLSSSSTDSAWKTCSEQIPSLIVTEVNFPDISGFDFCRRLHSDPRTVSIPLVFYTTRDEEIDRIVGFELGCLDYLSKDVSPRVVAHRISAILRRKKPIPTDLLRAGPVEIDFVQSIVTKDGGRIPLSPTEFQILNALICSEGKVLSRKEIIAKVWHKEGEVLRRTVDAHVKALRSKLVNVEEYLQIATIRGLGYSIRLNREQTKKTPCDNEREAAGQ
jgi:two-component system phosphate regulon response regulator PhoB